MPMQNRARPIPAVQHLTRTVSACIAAAVLIGAPLLSRAAHAGDMGFVGHTGKANTDSVVLNFTSDGKYVGQIGKIAPSKGSNDTPQLSPPAETTIDEAARELYVADGYGNRRVIVFDADTLAY